MTFFWQLAVILRCLSDFWQLADILRCPSDFGNWQRSWDVQVTLTVDRDPKMSKWRWQRSYDVLVTLTVGRDPEMSLWLLTVGRDPEMSKWLLTVGIVSVWILIPPFWFWHFVYTNYCFSSNIVFRNWLTSYLGFCLALHWPHVSLNDLTQVRRCPGMGVRGEGGTCPFHFFWQKPKYMYLQQANMHMLIVK